MVPLVVLYTSHRHPYSSLCGLGCMKRRLFQMCYDITCTFTVIVLLTNCIGMCSIHLYCGRPKLHAVHRFKKDVSDLLKSSKEMGFACSILGLVYKSLRKQHSNILACPCRSWWCLKEHNLTVRLPNTNGK